MAYDWLKGVADEYDVIVIGSGLGGLTGANVLAKAGHKVLLLEHHYQFGGLATWFTRKGGHIFDISLHGFPVGMIKSCRKYWSKEIADSIVQLKDIRFVNPQMDVWTTFTREDYTRVLVEQFKLERAHVERFYDHLRSMNYYDHNPETTGQMLERFFPGRDDVKRLLMEPISYANGSTLDDPAITYGIVFSNFMGAGVYTYRGGSDDLVEKMATELRRNGVELRKKVLVERVLVEERDGRKVACGIVAANGRVIRAKAILSNASIHNTIFRLAGDENFPADFVAQARRALILARHAMALTSEHDVARYRQMLCRRLAPRGRRQPVVAAAQQQRRDVGSHWLAFRRRRRRHMPHRTVDRQLARPGAQAVDAADQDRLFARRQIDCRPALATLDGIEQATELLGVLLEQAAVAVLEILGELPEELELAALDGRDRLGHQRRFAFPHHVQEHHQDLGAVHLHCLGAVIELQGQGEWLDHRLVNDGL